MICDSVLFLPATVMDSLEGGSSVSHLLETSNWKFLQRSMKIS